MAAGLFTRRSLPLLPAALAAALLAILLPHPTFAQLPCPSDSVAADYDPLNPSFAGENPFTQECHQNPTSTAGTFGCEVYCQRGDCSVTTELDHATGAGQLVIRKDTSLLYGLLVMRDRFTAHTTASGATTIEVRLEVTTQLIGGQDPAMGGSGVMVARLETPGGAVEWNAGELVAEAGETTGTGHQLESPRFVVHDGDTFDLRWTFTGWVYFGDLDARSQLSIVTIDGPPATLSSCRGYAALAVPVQAASWSGIKALYR